jgi:hypothetical protein
VKATPACHLIAGFESRDLIAGRFDFTGQFLSEDNGFLPEETHVYPQG